MNIREISKRLLSFNTLFLKPTDDTLVQMIRSLIAGIIALIIDVSTLYLCTEYLKIYYLYSASIGFIIGTFSCYLFSAFWIFNQCTYKNKGIEIGLFLFIGIMGLGLNALFMKLFTEALGLHYVVSKLITTILIFFWNFFARKKLVFSSRNDESPLNTEVAVQPLPGVDAPMQ